jgi:hypothetical protein
MPLAVVSLSIGIVGLPNVGKSTLFNALTRASALAARRTWASRPGPAGLGPVPRARPADVPHRRPEGAPGLGDQGRGDGDVVEFRFNV